MIYTYIYVVMLFGHLALCITVIIAVLVCPIAFYTFTAFSFFFICKRWLFKPLSYESCCGLSASK